MARDDDLAKHREEVRRLVQDPINRSVVFLVMHNVPIELASALNAAELEAWCIHIGEINRRKFDWDNWVFEDD